MTGFFNKKLFIRISALASSVILSLLPIVFSHSVGIPVAVFLGFFCALSALSVYPVTLEVSKTALFLSLGIDLADLAIEVAFLNTGFLPRAIVGFNSLAITVLTIWASVLKFTRVKSMFRQKAVLVFTQEHYRLVIRISSLALAVLFLSCHQYTAAVVACDAAIVSVYAAVHYSCRADRILLQSRGREKVMRELVIGNLRSIPDISSDEDARMSLLYARVTKFMETNKPYLHNSFTVKDLASSVFSNRSYLSKTINYFSGKNFSQFVNYYRVKYATELMKKDPNMRMFDVATLSGFHSVVTFNLAFRMYTDATPSAFREQVRCERKKK